MTANLSIVGLLQYGEMKNEDLFKNLNVPDGIDLETLKDNIIMECGKMELLYPDFEFMQYMIGVWSRKNQWTFEQWVKVIKAEFDPLYNYDRYEEWTDNDNVTGKTETETGVDTTGEDELFVSAYDSDAYHNKERTNTAGTSKSTGSSETNTDGTSTHSGHLYGNIGVTTSTELLESFADFANFNIYDQITALFKSEFCLLIY